MQYKDIQYNTFTVTVFEIIRTHLIANILCMTTCMMNHQQYYEVITNENIAAV